MPVNVYWTELRPRATRTSARSAWIPPARRARARRNFRENYNANSSTLHGYTRNVHRVHSSAEGCYTWSKPTCTVTYIQSLFPACIPTWRLCHRIGALQSRYLHITGVRRAGNRPSKYRLPPLGTHSLCLSVVPCKGRNAFPVSPLTKISIWHAANRIARLQRALFSNSIEWNRGIARYKIRSKYNRG